MTKEKQSGPDGDAAPSRGGSQILCQRAEDLFRKKVSGMGETLEALSPEETRQILHTARQLAEAERERLLLAIEQTKEMIVITDAGRALQYVNPAFETVTGYSREEAIGQNPRLLKSGKQDPAFYRTLWKTISSGRTWEGRMINKCKDGTLFTEEASISPVYDTSGRITNYVGVKRDMTGHLQLIDQFIQAQKMESIGRLAGGVDDPEIVEKALELGVYGYIVKPFNISEVTINVSSALRRQKQEVERRIYRGKLEEIVADRTARLKQALDDIIQVVAQTIEMKDAYIPGHQHRTADLAKEIGFSDDQLIGILMAGMIHDLGKIALPVEILSKTTKLTDPEFSLIKLLPQTGYDIPKDVLFPWPIAQIIRNTMNGSMVPVIHRAFRMAISSWKPGFWVLPTWWKPFSPTAPTGRPWGLRPL